MEDGDDYNADWKHCCISVGCVPTLRVRVVSMSMTGLLGVLRAAIWGSAQSHRYVIETTLGWLEPYNQLWTGRMWHAQWLI
jgi:hypothetical protein